LFGRASREYQPQRRPEEEQPNKIDGKSGIKAFNFSVHIPLYTLGLIKVILEFRFIMPERHSRS
jgi:hypothetical protein